MQDLASVVSGMRFIGRFLGPLWPGAGCPLGPALAEADELNWPVYQALVNGREVTVELLRINRPDAPERAVEEAVARFSRYVAGRVRMVQAEPVEIEADEHGLLTRAQLEPAIEKRRHRGMSDVTVLLGPGLSDSRENAVCMRRPDGHVIAVNPPRIDRTAPPLLGRERWWRVVVQHELCHALGVPCDRTHAWRGRHCTRPECILYPAFDARSLLAALFRFGPPGDLCSTCRREIRRAHQAGRLIGPKDRYDIIAWLDEWVRLNPDRWEPYGYRAQLRASRDEHDRAIEDYTRAIELDPKDKAVICYRNRGVMFSRVGRFKDALGDYERCLRAHADDAASLNNLAWLLATCPDDGLRDGPRAVELARRACELTTWSEPNMLSTLAAACAETGRFDQAVEHQKRAISLADGNKAKRLRKWLKLYQAGRPCRDPET